jgi:hypothetical protein
MFQQMLRNTNFVMRMGKRFRREHNSLTADGVLLSRRPCIALVTMVAVANHRPFEPIPTVIFAQHRMFHMELIEFR